MACNLHTHADGRALQGTHKVCWRPAGPVVVRTLPVWHMHLVGRTRRASARAWTPRRLGTHLLGTSSAGTSNSAIIGPKFKSPSTGTVRQYRI